MLLKIGLLQETGSAGCPSCRLNSSSTQRQAAVGTGFHLMCQQDQWEQNSLLLGKSKILLINRSCILESPLQIY